MKRVIFDCDGVLVESKNSYDLAIEEVLRHVFKPLNPIYEISFKEIERLRLTGLYNIEWDTTFALAMFIFSQLSKEQARAVLEYLKGNESIGRFEPLDSSKVVGTFNEFVMELKGDPIGDAENYTRRLCSQNGTLRKLEEFINILGRPNDPNRSHLVKIFDVLYYGNSLYTKVYGDHPPFDCKNGFIENEKTLVKKGVLNDIWKLFGTKFFLLTGRSRVGTEYVLKSIAEFFDFENSLFIEDIIRSKPKEASKVKKPSPIPLLNLANEPGTMYIGDSAEDLIMCLKAKETFRRLYFIGVTGAKTSPRRMEEFFMSSSADVVVNSVNDLAKVFKSIKGGEIF